MSPAKSVRDYESRLREMRIFEGVTCSLDLAFDHHSRLYVFEVQPDWYEDFLGVEDEIVSRMPMKKIRTRATRSTATSRRTSG